MATSPWTEELWRDILASAALPIRFEPGWYELPAIGRLTITRPDLLFPFDEHNRQHPNQAVRPHSFVSVAYPKLFERADDVRLFAPYVSDPREALEIDWYELRSGGRVRVTTEASLGVISDHFIHVKSYGDVAREYAAHPESKFLASNGAPCLRSTVGTLERRSVTGDRSEYIGKEGNLLDRRVEGLSIAQEAQQTFEDPDDFGRLLERLGPCREGKLRARLESPNGLCVRSSRDEQSLDRGLVRHWKHSLTPLCGTS